MRTSAGIDSAVIWHDVECAGYTADLPLWEGLADKADGPVLDLGCGTGRVALHLARRGHRVTGLDRDPELVSAFNERARGLPAVAEVGDARRFSLSAAFGLTIAPMQLIQLFASAEERIEALACVVRHLRPGGALALAIVEDVLAGTGDGECLPDVRELEESIYSSLPLETKVAAGEIVVRRRRETVSSDGARSADLDEVRLQLLCASSLEREAEAAGLRPIRRLSIPATDFHIGSTVVLLEARP